MGFNHYVWELYRKTDGQEAIRKFENRDDYDDDVRLFQEYNNYYVEICGKEKLHELIEDMWCYNISEFVDAEINTTDADEIYRNVLGGMEYKDCISLIPCLSMGLSIAFPELFVPYLFYCRFLDISRICDAFSIEMPPKPLKKDYEGRCLYYLELCKVLNEFRTKYNMTPNELCAFLYDFAPRFIEGDGDESIANASQVWMIGGEYSNKELKCDNLFWQANEDTRKGDLMIFYEKSPVSAITSIWRAKTDGISDPLFYYYSYTFIGDKTKVPDITLNELKKNDYFKEHPLVKKNFQGVNGFLLTGDDYGELSRLLGLKSMHNLPIIKSPISISDRRINVERDVEQILLEPLLHSFGLSENVDYKRQMGIHAGRGHRIFPDYSVFYSDKKNEETADILIEAKLHIKSNREREDAFLQARSYALLLHSSTIILCDKYYIWIYRSKNGFDRSKYILYQWHDLFDVDKFNEIRDIIMKSK